MRQIEWTWSSEDSPASPSQQPGGSSESATLDGSGPSSPASSPRSGRRSWSLKTCLRCDLVGCAVCWPTLLASGSMRSGRLFSPETSARPTSGIGSGSPRGTPTEPTATPPVGSPPLRGPLLPTPTRSSYGSSQNGDPRDGRGSYAGAGKPSLHTMARRGLLPTPMAVEANHGPTTFGNGSPNLTRAVGALRAAPLLPTPLRSDATNGKTVYSRGNPGLKAALGARKPTGRLPTPTASETHGPKALDGRRGRSVSNAVGASGRPSALLPTPTVRGNYNRKGASANSGDGLATAVGGTLHPRFVEWMMGAPKDWTCAAMRPADAAAKRATMNARRTPSASPGSETASSSSAPSSSGERS